MNLRPAGSELVEGGGGGGGREGGREGGEGGREDRNVEEPSPGMVVLTQWWLKV